MNVQQLNLHSSGLSENWELMTAFWKQLAGNAKTSMRKKFLDRIYSCDNEVTTVTVYSPNFFPAHKWRIFIPFRNACRKNIPGLYSCYMSICGVWSKIKKKKQICQRELTMRAKPNFQSCFPRFPLQHASQLQFSAVWPLKTDKMWNQWQTYHGDYLIFQYITVYYLFHSTWTCTWTTKRPYGWITSSGRVQ